jgi:hypothetical protein
MPFNLPDMGVFFCSFPDYCADEVKRVYAADAQTAAETFVKKTEVSDIDYPVGEGRMTITVKVGEEYFEVRGESQPVYIATAVPAPDPKVDEEEG